MKHLIFILTISLVSLASCGVPVVYESGYNPGDNVGDATFDDGSYRYDSSQRNARYEGFNTREAYGQREFKLSETGLAKLKQSTTNQSQTDRTARSFNRYDAYSKHGHTLHSSRYRSYHHSQRSPRNQANPSSF